MASRQAWKLLAKPFVARAARTAAPVRWPAAAAASFPTSASRSKASLKASLAQPRLFSTTPTRSQDGIKETPPSPPPQYELTFTCKPCGTRSAHAVSKQGYHHGSVLITCPGCRNRHIISDHLGIFGTKPGEARTIEDILRERGQGQLIKKGTLGEDGDLEFWEDGTASERQARLDDEGVVVAKKTEATKEKADEESTAPPGSTFQTAGKP